MTPLERLFGTWKLISQQFVFDDTGERIDMFGPDPLGWLVMTGDSRMITLITARERIPSSSEAGDAALFKSMMGYSGRFRIEGEDQFITDVDASWHPAWLGTEQARFFAIDGEILSIMTAETVHPMFPDRKGRGVLKWRRGL